MWLDRRLVDGERAVAADKQIHPAKDPIKSVNVILVCITLPMVTILV